MTVSAALPFEDVLERLSAVLAHVGSLAAAVSILGLVVIMGVIRLLAEWQRRLTMIAIVRHAPAGTVVAQGRGLGSPELRLQVGTGSPTAALQQPGEAQGKP